MAKSLVKKSWQFLAGFLKKLDNDHSIAYAYELTYGLLLAIFPFLIFLFTLIAYLGLDATYILQLLQENLPQDIYKLISGTVVDLVEVQRTGLLSLSVFLAIYTSSGGFRAYMTGINTAMGYRDRRNILYRYAVSILWVLLLALTILLGLVGIVFGRQILDLLVAYFPHFPVKGLLEVLRILVPVTLLFLILTLTYMFIPVKSIRFRHAFPGALFATGAWITLTLAFSYYVSNFANYSRFYGAMGAVIALLLWLSLTSIIMILGASLNAYLITLRKIGNPYVRGVRDRIIQRKQKAEVPQAAPPDKFGELRKSLEETLKEEDPSAEE